MEWNISNEMEYIKVNLTLNKFLINKETTLIPNFKYQGNNILLLILIEKFGRQKVKINRKIN